MCSYRLLVVKVKEWMSEKKEHAEGIVYYCGAAV